MRNVTRSRLASGLINAAVLVVTVLIAYLVGGQLALRYYFPHESPSLRSYITDLPDVVGQTSKRDTLPRDYVAILGDSYAEGIGDWRIQAETGGARRYHAGHVLHDLTGRDVISLGRWGYGSAQAMVRKPAWALLDRMCPAFPALDRPSKIMAYFYEGNDPIDNYRFVETRLPAVIEGNTSERIAGYFKERYGVVEWWRCHTYFALALRDWAKFVFERALPGGPGPRTANAAPVAPPAQSKEPNRIQFASGQLPVKPLLGPPLYMNEKQNQLSEIVFGNALAWLRSRFPEIPILVAYLPAPAGVYRFADETVWVHEGSTLTSRTFADLQAGSQALCERYQALTLERGAAFIDTRPALRAAAVAVPVHGPRDWDHFNEAGYRALGEELARAVARPGNLPCQAMAASR